MKIEKIDENQIRCILTSDDLESRHLSIQDLAYGSDKARSLFMEMVQAAATETDFKLDGIPLMIEAVPISNNGLMLIITRVEDPEELDMRFSRFTQSVPLMEYNDDGVSKPTVNSLLNTLKRYVE
ncbi:MAG: adaptor protein MecA, partial [Lachnospiraceae bacterium]|nr:adaptor protein MecA [Lachnospiraceae bacterium]